MTIVENTPGTSPLAQKTSYSQYYSKDLLFPITRQSNRDAMGIAQPLPFKGVDVWNCYELSWLNNKGKPLVALAELIFPCTSLQLIESKSLKLYLNSFNQTRFADLTAVQETIQRDLSAAVAEQVTVKIIPVADYPQIKLEDFTGLCLDDLDIHCDTYETTPEFLTVTDQQIEETLFSRLLRSNCPVTGQPDWADVQIQYAGSQIDHAGLLRYIISFRNHDEFGEQCVERIFTHIMRHCVPQKLTVQARFTRRGGLDINPYRSTENTLPKNIRTARQ